MVLLNYLINWRCRELTVAVSCNLSDGVILGVDSAISISNPQGAVLKVYEDAEKLFQLGEKPIGVSTFGMGMFGSRAIGSYIREFELANPNNVLSTQSTVRDVVEELRKFFLQKYQNIVVPMVQKATKKKFEEIPDDKKPILGLVVGGFSSNAFLSEVWLILIPLHNTPWSAQLKRPPGNFGSDWYSLHQPIHRYFKGYDQRLLGEITNYITQIKGSSLTPQEKQQLLQIVSKYEYQVPFPAMPIQQGVKLVKFLIELVINHYRFAIGAPIVGGKAHIGLVTYKSKKFKIIE